MYLGIRMKILEKLMKEKGWSRKDFADALGINYSHFHRILKGERNPGSKFFSGLFKVCKEEKKEFEDYVFIKKTNKM